MGSSQSSNTFTFLQENKNADEQLSILTQIMLYKIKSTNIVEKINAIKKPTAVQYHEQIMSLISNCVYNVTPIDKLRENKKNIEIILDKMLLL
jgi:hypothetical protein